METEASVTTLLTTVKTDLIAAIGEALPIAGTVFAVIAGIFGGIKIFKRVTGARS